MNKHSRSSRQLSGYSFLFSTVHNHYISEDGAHSKYLSISSMKISSGQTPAEIVHLLLMMAVHQLELWWKRLVMAWEKTKQKTKQQHFKSTFDVSPLFFEATHASVVL